MWGGRRRGQHEAKSHASIQFEHRRPFPLIPGVLEAMEEGNGKNSLTEVQAQRDSPLGSPGKGRNTFTQPNVDPALRESAGIH